MVFSAETLKLIAAYAECGIHDRETGTPQDSIDRQAIESFAEFVQAASAGATITIA